MPRERQPLFVALMSAPFGATPSNSLRTVKSFLNRVRGSTSVRVSKHYIWKLPCGFMKMCTERVNPTPLRSLFASGWTSTYFLFMTCQLHFCDLFLCVLPRSGWDVLDFVQEVTKKILLWMAGHERTDVGSIVVNSYTNFTSSKTSTGHLPHAVTRGQLHVRLLLMLRAWSSWCSSTMMRAFVTPVRDSCGCGQQRIWSFFSPQDKRIWHNGQGFYWPALWWLSLAHWRRTCPCNGRRSHLSLRSTGSSEVWGREGGYWTAEKFLRNVEDAAEFKYPADKFTIAWLFDHSSCHAYLLRMHWTQRRWMHGQGANNQRWETLLGQVDVSVSWMPKVSQRGWSKYCLREE